MGGNRIDLRSALGPIFFGIPSNNSRGWSKVPLQILEATSGATFDPATHEFHYPPVLGSNITSEWPLRKLEAPRITVPPDGPFSHSLKLIFDIIPAPPDPSLFTPLWARVRSIEVSSIAFLHKLLAEISELTSLEELWVSCEMLEGPRWNADGIRTRVYPQIGARDLGRHNLTSTLLHVRETLTRLEFDFMVNGRLAPAFWGPAGRLLELNTFTNITHLTVTLQALFGSSQGFLTLINLENYKSQFDRNYAAVSRFPPSLVSLKVIEY